VTNLQDNIFFQVPHAGSNKPYAEWMVGKPYLKFYTSGEGEFFLVRRVCVYLCFTQSMVLERKKKADTTLFLKRGTYS
jgi:hypothetical protein